MFRTKKGFTIIELLLAMTMVSFLMMAIAAMILQMTTLMTRGNTFRELNAAGRTVNDDFTRSFNSLTNGREIDVSQVEISGRDSNYVRIGTGSSRSGVFCTGRFSYLWNIMDNNAIAYAGSSTPVKLIRISDADKSFCRRDRRGGLTHLSQINQSEAKEIIGNGEVDLRLYDIRFEKLMEDQMSEQVVFKISYVLSTREGLTQSGAVLQPNCNPAGDRREYCAINKFELIVRTLGRG